MPEKTNSNPDKKTIYVAFGGNLGDVIDSFRSARSCIDGLAETSVRQSSRLYHTPAIGPAGQPDYCNAVIAIESTLRPLKLLDALQSIEAQHHRVRNEHWGPRTLDLDIIAINDEIIVTDRLNIPHLEMQNRQFVLQPLCDIAANWQHPILNKNTSQLLHTLLQSGETALPQGIVW